METVTRADLIDALMRGLNLEKSDAARLVALFFDEIVQALLTGESVHLSGLGNFDIKEKKARSGGRNPKTGEACEIAARCVVTFQAGVKLKGELKHE